MVRTTPVLIRSLIAAKMQSRAADVCSMQKIERLLHLSGSGRPQAYQSDSPIVQAYSSQK